MLYTEDFSMHHYVGFLQIGSHLFYVGDDLFSWQYITYVNLYKVWL